jgi:predicted nucleotidyltransferase
MLPMRSVLMQKVLRVFFTNLSARVYVNDLARRLEADPKNLHRVLVRLEADGLLLSEFQGNQRYFFSNRTSDIYKAYRTLFLRTSGVAEALKKELKLLPGLRKAHIFGSYANGRFGPESDIDLLLVGEHQALAAEKCLIKASRELGREINAVHITPEELSRKKAAQDTFIETVFSGKMITVL